MRGGLAMVDAIGARTVAFGGYVLELATIIGYGVSSLAPWRFSSAVTRQVLLRQVLFTGVEAVPFVALLATLTSLSLVVQGQLGGLAQSDLLGELLVVVLVRELGPLLIAMV